MDFEEIIIRAKNKDEEAFALIVEEYKSYIFAIILSFIKDEKEVENIAQEVFLQIYLSLDKYKDDNFKAWISRLTANKTIDYIRKKRVHFKERVLDSGGEIEVRPSTSNNPEDLILKKEQTLKLEEACRGLSRIYRDVIFDFYIGGMTYEEISSKENISKRAVESRLYRAKNLLRKNWRD